MESKTDSSTPKFFARTERGVWAIQSSTWNVVLGHVRLGYARQCIYRSMTACSPNLVKVAVIKDQEKFILGVKALH